MNTEPKKDYIDLAYAPQIAGLRFRKFRGESDYQGMTDVINTAKKADNIERTVSRDDMARNYAHLTNCDPKKDLLLAEIDGKIIGYSRVWWSEREKGLFTYNHFMMLVPAWRAKGIAETFLKHNEDRLREIAKAHPHSREQSFEAWSSDTELSWTTILENSGYQIVRYGYEMVRPNLNNIPTLDLPNGLEIRPVKPEQHQQIWDAAREAFRDHWGYSEAEWANGLDEWKDDPTFMPQLWQVAWDGDQVAGMILNFINEKENQEYNRKRGYTETISVRRPWRRQGLARALLARSLQVVKDQGMDDAALGVDAQNPNGALQLYESLGFRMVKQDATYRKSLQDN